MMPVLHPDATWDPAVQAVQKAARRLRDRKALDAEVLVFGAWADQGRAVRVIQLKRHLARVEIRDTQAVEAALLERLYSADKYREIIWCGEAAAALTVLQSVTGHRNIPMSGLIGMVAKDRATTSAWWPLPSASQFHAPGPLRGSSAR
jgi:hypothetical protein